MNYINVKRDILNQHKQNCIDAKKMGVSVDAVCLQHIKNNAPKVRKFVFDNGMQPSNNPAELALQALLSHEGNIRKRANLFQSDFEGAENSIFNEYGNARMAVNYDGEVYADFAPGLFASIFKAAKTGINKINEKRVAKGKKPILSSDKLKNFFEKAGQFVDVKSLGDDLSVLIKSQGGSQLEQSEIMAGLRAAQGSIIQDKFGDFMRKYGIIIALGVVAVVVVLKKKG